MSLSLFLIIQTLKDHFFPEPNFTSTKKYFSEEYMKDQTKQ